jgi:hypothetical protein
VPLDPTQDLLCGNCSQNLRGVTADRCPECGQRFDRARLLSLNIPWERRAHLGRLRAFGKTVVAVTFRPALLIDPADNPLTLRAARGFRLRTVIVLFVPAFLTAFTWYNQQSSKRPPPGAFAGTFSSGHWPDIGEIMLTPWFFYTSMLGLLLSLFAITGMASLFFAPRKLSLVEQQRGVAASLYANALLIWLVPLVGFASLGRSLAEYFDTHAIPGDTFIAIFKYLAMTTAAIALLAWWLIPCRLLYGVTRSKPRVLTFAIAWPLLCALTSVTILIGLHLAVTFLALVAETW